MVGEPGVGSTFAFYIEAYRPSEEALREVAAGGTIAETLSALRMDSSLSRRGSNKRAISSSTLTSDATIATANHEGNSGPSPTTTAAVTPSSEISISSGLVPRTPLIKGVLVVEDNLINQQITRRGLLTMGFTVDVANHGIEALDKLRRTDRFAPSTPGNGGAFPFSADPSSPGIGIGSGPSSPPPTGGSSTSQQQPFPLSMILMDIEMPVQDGLTCTRHIRELERTGRIVGGRIPIIAVSANARMEQILEAKEAGCDDVLVKPYRMPELLERMRIVMGRVAGGGGGEGERGG